LNIGILLREKNILLNCFASRNDTYTLFKTAWLIKEIC